MILLADVLSLSEKELDSFAHEVDRYQTGGGDHTGTETLTRTLQSLTAGRDLALSMTQKVDTLIHRLETIMAEDVAYPNDLDDEKNTTEDNVVVQYAIDLRSLTILQDIDKLNKLIEEISELPSIPEQLVKHIECVVFFVLQSINEVSLDSLMEHLQCVEKMSGLTKSRVVAMDYNEMLVTGHMQKILSDDVNLRALVTNSYLDVVEWLDHVKPHLINFAKQIRVLTSDEEVLKKFKYAFILKVIPVIAQTLETICQRTSVVHKSYDHNFLTFSFLELSIAEQEARLSVMESPTVNSNLDSTKNHNLIISPGVMNERVLQSFMLALDALEELSINEYETDLSVVTLPLLTRIVFGFVAHANETACKVFRQDLRDMLTMSDVMKESIEKLVEKLSGEPKLLEGETIEVRRFNEMSKDIKSFEKNLPLTLWLKTYLANMSLVHSYICALAEKAHSQRGITDPQSRKEIIESIVNLNFECLRRLLLIFKVEALSFIESEKSLFSTISGIAEIISSKLIPIVINAEYGLINERLIADDQNLLASIVEMQARRDVVLKIFATRVCRIALKNRSESFLYEF